MSGLSGHRAPTHLRVSVFWGLLGGLLYTLVDGYLDQTFGVQTARPARPVEVFHAIIDFVLPPITGVLFGIALHYVRLRARMADLEKSRADSLTGDLHKIERDQAVWVISASLLHELKNPLHSLGLLLDEALDVGELQPELKRALLLRARSQVERIAGELATLRALPSSTPKDLSIADLNCIIDDASKVIVHRSPDTQLTFDGDPQILVRANPAYVRIILENLFENAVDALNEHQTSTRRIGVRVGLEGQFCRVDVCDNGPGVDTDIMEHLFEPLNTSKPTGMGLGLAIARTLARAMGGELEATAQRDGAKFTLKLERAEREV
jgi:C4-dicarboxylate-specific signal transduction histidine kinase